jgi:hypothetical protein
VVNAAADADPAVLRISMDAKATAHRWETSRAAARSACASKRLTTIGSAKAKVTPVGILLPQFDELCLACVTSKVTGDCLVDVLELW